MGLVLDILDGIYLREVQKPDPTGQEMALLELSVETGRWWL